MKYTYYKKDSIIFQTNDEINNYRFQMINNLKVNRIIIKGDYIISYYNDNIISYTNKNIF